MLRKHSFLFLCIFACVYASRSVYAQPNIPNIVSDYQLNLHTGLPVLMGNVTDPNYTAIAANTADFRDKSADLLVSLFIDPDDHACYEGYRKITVTLEVKYRTVNTFGSPSATLTDNITLEVEKHPDLEAPDKERAYKVYKNAYWSEVRVLGVSAVDENGAAVPVANIPVDVKTELQLQRERYKTINMSLLNTSFNTISPALLTSIYNVHNVFAVQWNTVPWASEYELEWTFVSDFDPSGTASNNLPATALPLKFRNNSSRVRVPATQNFFQIPAIYNKGYICARVRPLTKGGTSLDKDVFGNWSFDPANTGTLFVSDLPAAARYKTDLLNGLLINNVNTQYSIQFSEDGKLLPKGDYADGTLRIRQSNMAVSTEYSPSNTYTKMGVVTETIYDFLGRPAITTLPGVTEPGFWYKANYNLDNSGNKYSYLNFDLAAPSPGNCFPESDGMGTTKGVSMYYSPANPVQTAQQARVADAAQFPFTRIVYEGDNASRPKMQSGVGYDHRIGSGHETQYIYGNPSQTELNRLFGTDAGYAEYYQKNMITDANGQVSITYTDLAGKTIATALAGRAPDGMDPLLGPNDDPLQDLGEDVTDDLLEITTQNPHGNQNLPGLDGMSYTVNRFLMVSSTKQYGISYSLDAEDFSDDCIPDFCADCIYDLELSLQDECGNYVIGNLSGNGPRIIRVPGSMINSGCDIDSVYAFDSLLTLSPGVYNLVKKLTVVTDVMEAYLDTIMQRDTCLKELSDFYQLPDLSDCYITCESCLEGLGTLSEFLAENLADFNNDEDQATMAYNNLKEDCESLCPDAYKDECSLGYEMMLQDVSPLGQYGARGPDDPVSWALSVFNTANSLPKRDDSQFNNPFSVGNQAGYTLFAAQPSGHWKNPRYRHPVSNTWIEGYYDENGVRVRVVVVPDPVLPGVYQPAVTATPMFDGVQYYVYPEQLMNTEDFQDVWLPSFARSLVVYHPEYFKYEFCSEAFNYTATMDDGSGGSSVVNTYQYANLLERYTAAQAISELGLTMPITTSALITALVNNDPFFSAAGSYAQGNLLGIPPLITAKNLFLAKLNNYMTDPLIPGGLDIVKSAYVNVHCGIGSPGSCVLTAPSSIDLSNPFTQPDQVWRQLAVLYATARQQSMGIAMKIFQATKRQGIYTDCIGTDEYTFPSGYSFTLYGGVPVSPCSILSFFRYSGASQRFPTFNSLFEQNGFSDPPTVEEMTEYGSQAGYAVTGKCPMQIDFENMLGLLAMNGKLSGSGLVDLGSGGYMGTTLYDYLDTEGNGFNANITVTPSSIDIVIAGDCVTTLSWPVDAPPGFGWADVYMITDVHTGTGGPVLYGYINNDNPTFVEIPFTTCLTLTGCSATGRALCKPTQDIKDLKALMNILSINGQLFSTSAFTLTSAYEPFITPNLRSILGDYPIGSYSWRFIPGSPGSFELTRGTAVITLSLSSSSISLPPVNDYTFTTFYPIPSSTSSPSAETGFGFRMVETDAGTEFYIPPGTTQQNVEGTLSSLNTLRPVYASDCEMVPDPRCNTQEHKNLRALEKGLKMAVKSGSFDYLDCISWPETFTNNTAFDAGDIIDIVSVYAVMNMSTNGQNSNFAQVNVILTGNVAASFILESCHPFKNCDPCGEDTCRTAVLELDFDAFFDMLNSTSPPTPIPQGPYSMTYAGVNCFILPQHNFSYDPLVYPTFQAFQEAWVAHINTQYGSIGVHAFMDGGTMVIEKDMAFLQPGCRCDKLVHHVMFKKTLVALDTVACCTEYGGPSEPPALPRDGSSPKKVASGFTPKAVADPDGFITVVEPFSYDVDCYEPVVPFPRDSIIDPCVNYLMQLASENAWNDYQAYLDSVRNAYRAAYTAKCMSALETLDLSYTEDEYHYTLYYYDRAGNLVRTVPPAGVKRLPLTDMVAVNTARDNGTEFKPDHNNDALLPSSVAYLATYALTTRYRYNALNQPIVQKTPDGGISRFWYDNLGRIIISQNARQTGYVYAYTKYDAQSRITEVGEMERTDAAVADQNNLHNLTYSNAYLSSGYTKGEFVKTYYDIKPGGALAYPASFFSQDNLRKRVTLSTYYKGSGETPGSAVFSSATYFDYDYHGNVRKTLEKNTDMPNSDPVNFDYNFSYHKIEYRYDIVSGKVLEVSLNVTRQDKFIHRYKYDEQNRLLRVQTSKDGYWFDTDAEYVYYYHGPLARTEYGPYKSQGADYTYTLHGWLKGINSDQLDADKDPSGDGKTGSPHAWAGRDAYGFSLQYYQGDYSAISGSQSFLLNVPSAYYSGYELYNGNIRAMNNTLKQLSDKNKAEPLLQVFAYDQLNRIAGSRTYIQNDNSTLITDWNASAPLSDRFRTSYRYDGNGNIEKLNRYDKAEVQFDKLEYGYTAGTNQLAFVGDDPAFSGLVSYDIDDQGTYNYVYDATGNLILDASEEITSILWNAYGKITRVIRNVGSSKPHLEFTYNSAGQRTSKTVLMPGGETWTDFYVPDAQGNTMAIYKLSNTDDGPELYLEENNIYGSNRLGSLHRNEKLNYTPVSAPIAELLRGKRRYELSNHLGNVHVVFTDRKQLICNSTPVAQYYEAEILNTYDYYPFGMLMQERKQEKIDSIIVEETDTLNFTDFENPVVSSSGGIYTYDGWTHWSPSSLAVVASGGSQKLQVTSTSSAHGTHQYFNVVPGQTYTLKLDLDVGTAGQVNIIVWEQDPLGPLTIIGAPLLAMSSNGTHTVSFTPTKSIVLIQIRQNPSGTRVFYLDNISFTTKHDIKVGRVAGSYRYGFNGKEKIDEQYGEGNAYDFGARMYDPRTGRFLSIDPLASLAPGLSPYTAMANNPILMFDADGQWPWPIWARSFISTSTTGSGKFRGDGRGPSTVTTSEVTSRVWLNFTYDATNPAVTDYKVRSDYTLFYGIPPAIPPKVATGKPSVEFTSVNSEKNSFGNNIGSFGFHYWGKDPITPQWATPALDVHANFSITESLDLGILFVNATFTGDKFPSTEAFIEDQSGFKLFLGARKEEGGLNDLFGDNKKFLFNVDMQIKFDENGNFTGVYDQETDTYISPDAWNKRVQERWDKSQEE
ncbi:MAG: RHS repeat-associated core domain-containing protein [Flavobacteriales bacterium]